MKEKNIQYLIATLSEKNNWFSAAGLASYLHTTTRTVRNYVNEINCRYGSPVILTSHRGYRWDNNANSVIPYRENEKNNDTPEKRKLYILKELMYLNTENRENELTIGVLCDRLAISERTLMIDLDAVRGELKENGLALHLKKNILSVTGKEHDQRQFIFRLISNNKKVLSTDLLQQVYPAIPVNTALCRLRERLNQVGTDADAYHLNPLMLMIMIQIMRVSNHHLINREDILFTEIETYPEYRAALSVSETVNHELGFAFGKNETAYLAVIMLAMCCTVRPEEVTFSDEISVCSAKFISLLEDYDGLSWKEEHFPERLKDFINRMIVSCRFRISVTNPVRSALRNFSPILHEHAVCLISEFSSVWNLRPDADQIAFFEMLLLSYRRKRGTTHIPITCTLILPGCFGLEDVLEEKIEDHFHKLISVKNVIHSTSTDDLKAADMYISVLPFADLPHTVVISPALTPENYRMIQNEISIIEQEKRYRDFEAYLRNFSKAEFFERNHLFSCEEEAISCICEKLEKENYVTGEFRDDILKREKTDTTAYHNLIAVPHAVSTNVLKNVIYVIVNDKPMTWGKRRVNIIVLVAMEKQMRADYERFTDVLVRLFETRNTMKQLLETEDYSSFLSRLERIGRTIAQKL